MTTETTIVEQNNITLEYTVVDQDNAAVDLTGATIKWSIKKTLDDTAALTKTTSSGISVNSPASLGIFTVSIDDADTEDLAEGNEDGIKYFMEAVITDSGGNIYTITSDDITPDFLHIRPIYTEA